MAQRLFSRLSLLQSLCRIPKPRLEPRSTFLTLFPSTNLLSWFYFLKSHVWCFRLEALSDSITSRNGVNLWVSHNLQGLPPFLGDFLLFSHWVFLHFEVCDWSTCCVAHMFVKSSQRGGDIFTVYFSLFLPVSHVCLKFISSFFHLAALFNRLEATILVCSAGLLNFFMRFEQSYNVYTLICWWTKIIRCNFNHCRVILCYIF